MHKNENALCNVRHIH